jgi:hypothetical protein
MASTGEGHIAVGAADGSIRLYTDRSLTRAKSMFPGLGSPITAMDVSYDGKWILATTATYLIVVTTAFRDKAGAVTTGFHAPMGSNMTAPRLLQLLPVDVKRTGGRPLTKGRFTWVTEQGVQERWIVASVGNYSVRVPPPCCCCCCCCCVCVCASAASSCGVCVCVCVCGHRCCGTSGW